jgi:hypothetical protein
VPNVTTGWICDLTIVTDHDFHIYTTRATILVHNVEPCDINQPKSFAESGCPCRAAAGHGGTAVMKEAGPGTRQSR